MDIHNINTQTTQAFSQRDPDKRNEMGHQEFLQLLVAQMRHQDPINPMDGAEFAAQLAQFNSVEQLINVNDGIQRLQESQDDMSMGLTNSLATSLTGKQVRAISDHLFLPPDGSVDIPFKLANAASEADIVIRNEQGNVVYRESFENLPAGENNWTWDGRNNDGDPLPGGMYQVEVEAFNDDESVQALTYIEGMATRVKYTGDGVMLAINGVNIPISDVEEVGMPL